MPVRRIPGNGDTPFFILLQNKMQKTGLSACFSLKTGYSFLLKKVQS
jgi:hypothetical protein